MYHNHSHCQHDLKYCHHCDIVYCTRCGKEWGKQHYHYNITATPWVWTYNGVPYTVTYSNGNYNLTTSNGTAVTNKSVVSAFYSSTNNTDNISPACSHT